MHGKCRAILEAHFSLIYYLFEDITGLPWHFYEMQNLHLTADYSVQFEKDVSGIATDVVGNRLFLVSDKRNIRIFDRTTFQAMGHDLDLEIGNADEIVNIYYAALSAELFVMTRSGDIWCLSPDANSRKKLGRLDEGITTAAWSPDGDICAIVTPEPKSMLYIVSTSLHSISEKRLSSEIPQQEQQVSVGWGKKETQFHGKEGKSAAFVAHEQLTKICDSDDRCTRISWRADSQYFAVHFVDENLVCRHFRVFGRDGALISTMEAAADVGQAMTWRSYSASGLIATSQYHGTARQDRLIFFEKNGLRHMDPFELPFAGDVKIVEVLSTADSKILFVHCEKLQSNQSYVLACSISNYRWYVKYTLTFSGHVQVWVDSGDRPSRLYVGHASDKLKLLGVYDFSWAVDKAISNQTSKTCVGVISADEVLLVPFGLSAPPPPSCHARIRLPNFVNSISFIDSDADFLAGTSDGAIYLVKYRPQSLSDKPTQTAIIKPADSGLVQLRHITQLDMDHFIAVIMSNDGSNTYSTIIRRFNVNSGETVDFKFSEGLVKAICPCLDNKFCLLELADGRLFSFDAQTNEIRPFAHKFPRFCPTISTCKFQNDQVVAVGLTAPLTGGPLYVGTTQMCSNATSFASDSRFLVFTTTEHKAFFVPVSRLGPKDLWTWFLDATEGLKSEVLKKLVTRPLLDRGAVVVAMDSLSCHVILEMPRGNLETIYPRPIILDCIRHLVSETKYDKAFDLSVKHRVGLTYLYDLDPSTFRQNVEKFCRQLRAPNKINLFICDLVDDNVIEAHYPPLVGERTGQRHESDVNGKVDSICDLLLETLTKLGEREYLLSILTCYTKKTIPELESALLRLQHVAKTTNSSKPESEGAILDEGLKYLARILPDASDLYEISMSTYDLEFTLKVAERTNRDPREYLPELSQFRAIEPESYRKYRIDRRTLHPARALIHLIESGGKVERFDELYRFVVEDCPDLLPQAAKLVDDSRIWSAYADRLALTKNWKEAGIASLRAKDASKAIAHFCKAKTWQLAEVAAYSFTGETREAALRDIAESASEVGCHLEAGNILEHSVNDLEAAFDAFVAGHEFLCAYSLLMRYGGNVGEVGLGHLEQSVLSFAEDLATSLSEATAELEGFYSRLVAVDEKRHLQNGEMIYAGGGDADETETVVSGISGAQSIRSSKASSRMSSRSGSPAKWRLKPGSSTERFAIMERLISYASKRAVLLKNDVIITTQVLALVANPNSCEASKIAHNYRSLLSTLKKCIQLAWKNTPDAESMDESIQHSPMLFVVNLERDVPKTVLAI